ncbi:MAG: site-specific DNA-methyltransferase [Clostridia bacterium]|nr:site-specific DNA-methyltransferase [Clostridia bacterium]
MLRNKDNIIVYKKGEEITINPQYVERNRWDTHYNAYGVFNDGKLVEIKKFKDVLIENGIITTKQAIKEDFLNNQTFYDFIIKHKNNICRLVNSMPDEMKKMSKNNPSEIIEYKDENNNTRYAYNGSRVSFLNSSIMEIDNEEKFVQLLGDLWIDIDFQNTQNEGKVSFPASKKPEALIKRILDMVTEEGDIVLDSFLGSGTTCAVAHKMRRKWIGIELGDHAYTHCKVRLDAIIKNEDLGGITKSVNWQGGGGYKFYELAPTLIKEDDFGQTIINPEYNAEMLASAVAKHEGYFYNPDNSVFWKQSNNQGKSYLFVTTNHVNSQLIETIKADMQEDEFVLIVCKSFDSNCNSYKNIAIKKIPQSLLKNCKFGVDNYNLNIICPPEYDEEGSNE